MGTGSVQGADSPPSPFGARTRLRGLVGVAIVGGLATGVTLGLLDLSASEPAVLSTLLMLGLYAPILWWLRRELAGTGTSLAGYVGRLPRERAPGAWALLVLSFFGLAFADLAISGTAARQLDESMFLAWFTEAATPEQPYGTPARWLVVVPWMLAVVVLAPLVEELVFRGLLVDVLEARRGRTYAWLVSATIFGLLHAPLVPHSIFFALVLSAVRASSGSLALPVALHAANNFVPTLFTSFALASDGQISGSDGTLPGGVWSGLALLALCLPLPVRALLRGWRARASVPTAP